MTNHSDKKHFNQNQEGDKESKMEMRVESDSLGTKEVPKQAYYGIQTIRAKENFPITGYQLDSDIIVAMAQVKRAAATANGELGYLSAEFQEAIVQASEEIIDGEFHDQFLVDPIQGGAGTSVNMNANEVIANRALEILGKEKGDYETLSPNTHVNMAQSTNDTFPTGFRLAVLWKSSGLLETMGKLSQAFKAKSEEFDDVIKMGRTHLQDAVPIRLGQEFGAYHRVVERDIIRIKQAEDHLLDINLGATAVGTGLNADPEYIERVVEVLADITNLPLRKVDNLVDGTQNTDAITTYSSALKIAMVNLSKIANDLRLMASGPRAGLGEISLPERQPGSSIMPGKVNPVMIEVINQIAFQVIGNDLTISAASEAGQMELNVMEPVMVFNILESQTIMTNGLRVFTDYCLKGITANEERLKDYVESTVGTITALNPHIGYEKSSTIAKEALKTGEPVREIALEKGVLTKDQIEQILDPFQMTKPGMTKLD